jgi:hypothetical protein
MNLRRIKKYKNLERIFYLNFKFRRVNSTLISGQTKIMSCELRYWSMEIGLTLTQIPYDTDLVNTATRVKRCTRGILMTKVAYFRDPLFSATRVVSRL